MKKAIIVTVILLLGAGLLVYPGISGCLSEKNSSYATDSYKEAVESLDEEKLKSEWEKAEIYNRNLSAEPVQDPFIEEKEKFISDNYYEVLALDKVMGYIEIPQISVYLPIYHGTGSEVLTKGIGHLEGSALPIGGKNRHSVLTGHTGLTYAKLFTDLVELKEGDLFYVHVLGEVLAYEVDQIQVVEPSQTKELQSVEGKDYCTLLTCTPYGVNSHRLMVRGIRTEYIPDIKEALAQVKVKSSADRMVKQAAVMTAIIMLILVFITAIITHRRSRKNSQYDSASNTGSDS